MIGDIGLDYLARGVLLAMVECEREITKEEYEQAKKGDFSEIFEAWEVMGYGVYAERVFERNGKYFVSYSRGSSCD